MKMTMISAADKEQHLPECEPGEMVTVTGVLQAPDAKGNYPIAVESISSEESEYEGGEEGMPPPAPPPPKQRKARVAAVLNEE